VEPITSAQLKILVHLDCLERTDFDANLATHAHRDVDIEHRRIKLRFAYIIRLFVFALCDVDALRRTLLLANLAGDTSQARVCILTVVNQEWEIPIVFGQRVSLFRVLNRYQTIRFKIAADEISRRHRHAFEYACTEHCLREVKSLKR